MKGISPPPNTNVRLPPYQLAIYLIPFIQPIMKVDDKNLACNVDFKRPADALKIPAGSKAGALWGHCFTGSCGSGDNDHPIAKSHKGPTTVYMFVFLLSQISKVDAHGV